MSEIIENTDLRFANVSTLIVKVTHRCNLDCLNCYENITKTGEDMPVAVFKKLADKVLKNTRQSEVLFLFHGGEPTILKNDWYDEVIDYAKQKAVQCRKKIKFSMQTNLLALSEAKIELFKKYDIQLGISLDGTIENFSDSMRGGEPKVFQNYLKVKKAGIKTGILTTINQANFDKFTQICDFLVRQAKVDSFKANVVSSVGRGYNLPDLQAEQIFLAQKTILDYMIATQGEKLIENNLALEIQRFFATETERKAMPKTLCHEKRCGAGKKVLGVTPTGELLPCGRFQWNEGQYFLGNITELIANQVAGFEQAVNQFQDLVPQSWYDCPRCKAQKICSYGCQAFIVRSKSQANIDCLPTKMRYAYYREHKEKLKPVLDAIRKKSTIKNKALHFSIKNERGELQQYTIPLHKSLKEKPSQKSFWKLIAGF